MRSFQDTDVQSYRRSNRLSVRLAFLDGPVGELDEVLVLEGSYTYSRGKVGELRSVELSAHDPLDPQELVRFPWPRWLRVLDAHARARTGFFDAVDEWSRPVSRPGPDADIANRETKKALAASRPGRHGHGDDFYEQVARDWMRLAQSGVRGPNAALARERNHSVDTVNGWIRESRVRGFLPPSTRSRGASS